MHITFQSNNKNCPTLIFYTLIFIIQLCSNTDCRINGKHELFDFYMKSLYILLYTLIKNFKINEMRLTRPARRYAVENIETEKSVAAGQH